MMQPQERRQWPRRRVNLKVIHTHPKTQKSVMDFSRDLSLGGLFFWTKRQRSVGDLFRVELSATQPLSPRGAVKASCAVTRVTAEGIAARFTALDPGSEELLQAFLAGPALRP
jgi:hypothetical protein